ncbi:hypothetical protein BDW62DRAFT_206487 [Aspergillus aurantiobrunneus]
MEDSKDFHVLILGGGNCGLAIATGLKRAGISYRVFERDDEDKFYNRPRDWGMLLHWGAEHLEHVLPEHLRARLKEIRCDPYLDTNGQLPPVPYVNALTGEITAEIPIAAMNRVSRKKLRRFLTTGEDLDIHFAKCLESMVVKDDKVHALFADGTTAIGDMAIGCDGSRSKVREFLVGYDQAQLEPVDLTMINFPKAGYTADEARLLQSLHPVFKIAPHPEKPGNAMLAAMDIPDPDEPAGWSFQNYIGWWGPPYAKDLQDPQTRMQFYRDWVSPLCEPFRTGLMNVAEDETVPVYAGQQWAPTMQWDTHGGRVTLAGDAAHSMVPQRGQGLNNAMKDAATLVDIVSAVTRGEMLLVDGITRYEDEMKPRGATEVALSLEQALKARDQSTLKESPLFKQGWKTQG